VQGRPLYTQDGSLVTHRSVRPERAWCPKDRFATSPDGEPGQHHLCPSYKAFFHHVRAPMEEMCGLLRRGAAPAD